MLELHSQVSSSELAVVSGLDVASMVVDSIHETRGGWLALVPVAAFIDSPLRVSANLNARISRAKLSWWKRLTSKLKRWPCEGWMVAAEIAEGAWIWLGNASCHSWSEDVPTKMIKGDMVLEDRIPRDLFLRVRHGEAWIDLGGGLALDGMPDTPAAQRLQTIKSKERGDVFLERWEGEQFALQFDQRRSVFYFMTMEREPMPQQFASCSGAASFPVAPEECLEMHCPCCGIDMGSIRPDVHMTREFGFFVLTWLLDHNELPSIWPSSANTRIEWVEAAA